MAWLLDTNVVSEFYKRERGAKEVYRWIATVNPRELFLSVLVLGEIRRGVELMRTKDRPAANSLERWLGELNATYGDRILPISQEICDIWGRLSIKQRIPDVDGLLAATALHHRLTLASRNIRDLAHSGVSCFNPFVHTASS